MTEKIVFLEAACNDQNSMKTLCQKEAVVLSS